MQQQLTDLIALVHRLQTNRQTRVRQNAFSWTMAELHSTSWRTAATTGAISFMPYPEVKRYTEIYDLQHAFLDLQQRGFASSLAVEGLATLLQKNTAALTSAELSNAEERIGIALANVKALQDIAEPLDARYEELLTRVPAD